MKFRVKHLEKSRTFFIENVELEKTIGDLRNLLDTSKMENLRFSLNGKDPLDENRTIEEFGLVNGDTIYLLTENKLKNIDRPLRLDEVRDNHHFPPLIERIFDASKPKTDFDLILVVLHTFMLETGFQMDAENNFDLNPSRKSSTFYVIRYRHKLCNDEKARCSLAVMKTDSVITMNGVINSISQACGKHSFNISSYLYTQKEVSPWNSTFPYHDLDDLSRSFKDKLAHPLLCKLFEESGQSLPTSLIGLPNEIKLRIAKRLPIRSLLNLQTTCRDFYNTLNDNLLWNDLYRRDFEKTGLINVPYTIDSNSQEKNWYKFYRVIYTQKQTFLKNQMKSSVIYHSPIIPVLPAAHRLVFPDPTNGGTVSGFHPFSAPIYRPIPAGIFPATMFPLPPGFHPVWLG